jgi:hypothetical protein
LCGQRVYQKHHNEEVEGIEGPAQEAGSHCMPVSGNPYSGTKVRRFGEHVRELEEHEVRVKRNSGADPEDNA